MSPIRLLILFVLLYILYRLLTGGRKKKNGPLRQDRPAGQLAAQDILVEDPNCHTYIPKGQAVVLKQEEETFYFCSEKCRQAFIEGQQQQKDHSV